MKTNDFEYPLPPELIAQTPVEPRDQSRLMVLGRDDGSVEHGKFCELVKYLRAGDVLVLNNSRVIPARLNGRRIESGGKVEMLLLRKFDSSVWEAMVKPGKRANIGTKIEITNDSESDNGHGRRILAEVTGLKPDGVRTIRFSEEGLLPELGNIPLPPYIRIPLTNPERYQTVYASIDGSVAAPTAGLHFTQELINEIKEKGVRCLFVTLHVGLDTFRPVRETDPLEHSIYKEYGVLGQEAAAQLCQAKAEGRRIICVGTTMVRLVEQAAQASKVSRVEPFEGWANLFILPGHQFRVVDGLITNFHLPRTTLLMLVTAFAGKDLINRAYKEAIDLRYRFYSFGDAMLIS
ncbi:tRNA preQ1(34) S-adenosylmethionine ribosyltransferase-isomerase QueA [Chloroflexota bacterium]